MPEHHFAQPDREWRFDFAWPEHRLAVEIEGGLWASGRHQFRKGFEKDAEKYEAAMLARWTVYRIPGSWHRRQRWRPECFTTIRTLLARARAAKAP